MTWLAVGLFVVVMWLLVRPAQLGAPSGQTTRTDEVTPAGRGLIHSESEFEADLSEWNKPGRSFTIEGSESLSLVTARHAESGVVEMIHLGPGRQMFVQPAMALQVIVRKQVGPIAIESVESLEAPRFALAWGLRRPPVRRACTCSCSRARRARCSRSCPTWVVSMRWCERLRNWCDS